MYMERKGAKRKSRDGIKDRDDFCAENVKLMQKYLNLKMTVNV